MSVRSSVALARVCLLCGGLRHREVFDEFGIAILQCRDCRHIFSSFPGHAHYDGFWGDHIKEDGQAYWSRARTRMYRDFIARFVIGRSGRLLDMGCGLGYFLQEMAAHPTWSSQGCEISPTAVRYARTRLSLTDVLCARLEEAPYPPESFDIVTLWDVLDHLLAPDPVLRRCHTLLRPGGFCFIRTPNVALHLPRARAKRLVRGMRTGLAYLQARDHMHHYSMAALRQLLRRNGFAAIAFIHLHPVESISRRGSALARLGREAWYQGVRALAVLSSGRLNYDNLFVVASKARAPR